MVKNFLRDFEFLRVLSVKCDNFPRRLPNEVGNLKNLHYLGLGCTGYIEIPHTISNLKGLLTFEVQECDPGVILPDVIWTMKQLRHILLPCSCCGPSFCGINLDRIFYRTEICLPNLQTLYGLTEEVCGDFNFLHKLVNLRKLGVNCSSGVIIKILLDPTLVLTKLEKLSLSGSFSVEIDLSRYGNRLNLIIYEILRTWNLSRYENLLSLKLKYIGWWNSELPHDTFPPNLAKLTLVGNCLKEDPMETLMLCLVRGFEEGFGKGNGKVLKIEELGKLEELIVEEGGMPRLKELGIFECNPITMVPDRIKNIMEIDKQVYYS
ncbi:hypothetical protein ACSBR1_005730 [Camellia fascicularis]